MIIKREKHIKREIIASRKTVIIPNVCACVCVEREMIKPLHNYKLHMFLIIIVHTIPLSYYKTYNLFDNYQYLIDVK